MATLPTPAPVAPQAPEAREAWRRELHRFALALQFLTRIPVPASVPWSEAALQASARYFPAVGLIVGGVVAAVAWGASVVFPPTVSVGLALAASLALTGAFHEDGWADTCDALGGAVTREKALAIMKDSRLGTYGVAGLVLMLGLKAASLVALPATGLLPWIVFTQSASRLAPLWLMRRLRYAGDLEHAKAKPLATSASGSTLGVAGATVLALAAGLVGGGLLTVTAVLSAVAAAGAVLLLMGAWLRRRLGGYTGDTLGAAQQATELTMLLAALAAPAWA